MPDALSIEMPAFGRITPWWSPLVARWRAHLGLKWLLSAALAIFFCLPYFAFGFHPLFPPERIAPWALDQIIPFDPNLIYVYVSLYLFIPIAPFLAASREDLVRYARAFVCLTLVGLSICICWPIQCPRQTGTTTVALYDWIIFHDPRTMAFPSMHMALATQSWLMGLGMLRAAKSPWLWPAAALGALWLLAIAYSTLTLKQHYFIDVVAGVLLAVVLHWALGRSLRKSRGAP